MYIHHINNDDGLTIGMSSLTLPEPKCWKDFLGNKGLIRNVQEATSKSPFHILIIGASGGGKTTFARIVLKELSSAYDILSIDGEHFDDIKSLKSLTYNFIHNKTIQCYFSNRKKLIFIDDIDILLSIERYANSFISTFIEELMKDGKVCLMVTCNNSEEKRVTDLKKKMLCLRMSMPTTSDVFLYISDLIEKDGSFPEYDAQKLLRLIEVYNHNIRNIINNIHNVWADEQTLKDEKSQRVMFDSTVFDMMQIVLKKKLSTTELAYVSDSSLVPMLVYENYQNELFKNKERLSKGDYLKTICQITDGYLDGEIVERYMFQSTDWSLYDLATFQKCGYTNMHLNAIDSKKNTGFDKYVFTQLLTKSALKYNYHKKLADLKAALHIHDVMDVMYFFDGFALDVAKYIHRTPKLPKSLLSIYMTSEQWTIVCTYYSQFYGMDKTILNKIKKMC